MAALARDIPSELPYTSRKRIIESWFADDSPARVKCAALNYLAKRGPADDFVVAEREYTKNDKSTLTHTINCMVSIRLRTGPPGSAQKLVLSLSFESLAPTLLESVVRDFETLETTTLEPGLTHPNARVRLETLNVLVGRRSLDSAIAERLLSDSDAVVRGDAIRALSKLGVSMTQEEIKKALVQPQQQPGYSGSLNLSVRDTDKKGQELFDEYLSEQLWSLSDSELTDIVDDSATYIDDAYFVRAEKFPAKYSKHLRDDVDDLFSKFFAERTRRTILALGIETNDSVTKILKDRERHIRQLLTRKGLDILCRHSNRNDLERVRSNLRSGYAGVSVFDATFLGKSGEWRDIELLVGALSYPSYTSILTGLRHEKMHDEVSKAVVRIGRAHPVSEFFGLALPEAVLKGAIERCGNARFSSIHEHTLLQLFGHESADVRRAASIRAVLSLTRTRIRDTLREYIASDKRQYYNVIYWLDLGASMSRAEAKRVARARF